MDKAVWFTATLDPCLLVLRQSLQQGPNMFKDLCKFGSKLEITKYSGAQAPALLLCETTLETDKCFLN